MKIMRLRICDSLTIAFKHVGKDTNITKKQIEEDEYINNYIDTNLAFYDRSPTQLGTGLTAKRTCLQ